MAIYDELDWTPTGKVAVKLSTGEPSSNYLRPELIGNLVRSLDDAAIVECNTAYGGSRASTACTSRLPPATALPPLPTWTPWTRTGL